MFSFLILMFITFGLLALALSQTRHQKTIFTQSLSVKKSLLLSFIGWGISFFSLAVSVVIWGWGLGLTLWFALTTLAALFVIVFLSYKTHKMVS